MGKDIIERGRLVEDKGTYKQPKNGDYWRVVRLEVDDATTFIDKDASDNMTFEDAVTGSKTLAELSAGAGGDVVGPASSTDAVIALFDSTTGKLLKVAPVTLTNDGTKTTIMGTTGDYNRIGDANTTSHSLASEDDVVVTGKLEVNGITYCDGELRAAGNLALASGVILYLGGDGYPPLLKESLSDSNAKCLHITLTPGSGDDTPAMVITDGGNADFGLFDGVTQPIVAVIEKDGLYTSGTDASSAAAGATITKTGAFANSVIGDIVRVTAGTNATAGWYWITTVTDANNVDLDRNWCTGAVSSDGVFVAYHSFTLLSAEGICTRITDGAPTDASVEIDRDGWVLIDVANDRLYMRSGSAWVYAPASAEVATIAAATKLDDHAAPDDNTDLDFSTSLHGLVPKGTNTGDFLKDDGTWAAPAGGGDVTGPASSTDNEIARQHSTTGKVLQTYTSNPPTISDTGDLNIDGDLDVENIVVSGNVDGRDVSVDGTKLDGVESSATADQTGAEIKTAYEAEANAFTDTKNTKLAGIATGATLYPDTGEQAFLDADHTKLDGIATAATKYPDTGEQAFLDADHTKLDGIAANAVAAAGAVSAVEAAGVTFAENKGIILDAALSADGKYSGIIEAGTAGATLAFGDIVYLAVADSRWELAKADVAATSKGKIGMVALAANADGDATTVLLYGKVRADAAFPAFTIGAEVFISAATAGDLTSTAPTGTTNFVVRIVGYANTADELFFCPDNSYVELA